MTRLRVMRAEMGFVDRGDGSCSFSAGKSVVWASVNGPGDAHPSKRHGDRMYIDSSFRPASGETDDIAFAPLLQAALEHTVNTKLFPRTALQVTVHELQSAGSTAATALTAAGLATLDGGVPMKGPFCGVQICRVNGALVVDPDSRTEGDADAFFTLAYSTEIAEDSTLPAPILVASSSVGQFSLAEWKAARALGAAAAMEIFQFFKETLQRKATVESIA